MSQALVLNSFQNPCFQDIVRKSDYPKLQKGWELIDQKDPEISKWLGKRKNDLLKIQKVADEARHVETELEVTTQKIGSATDQVETSDQERKNIEKMVKSTDEAYNKQHSDLQTKLQKADQIFQNQQRMFNIRNPFYSEWGMKYGPHALTAAIPLLGILYKSQLEQSCSTLLSLECAQFFLDPSIYFSLFLAAGVTYLSRRAAAQAKPLLNDVSSLREKVQVCETTHQKTKQQLEAKKLNAEKNHKQGIETLREASDAQVSLTKEQNLIKDKMNSIQTSIIGKVYDRCVDQLENVFNELKKDPQNMFAKKMGIQSMQNVVDLIVVSFSNSKHLLLEGNHSALPIEDKKS